MNWADDVLAQTETIKSIQHTLDCWIKDQIANGEPVPDFWSETNASESIAAYLTASGLRYSR